MNVYKICSTLKTVEWIQAKPAQTVMNDNIFFIIQYVKTTVILIPGSHSITTSFALSSM